MSAHLIRPANPATASITVNASHPSLRTGHISAHPASPATAPGTSAASHPSRQAEHVIFHSARQTVSAPCPARGTNINGNPKPKSAGRTLAGIFLHGLKTQ